MTWTRRDMLAACAASLPTLGFFPFRGTASAEGERKRLGVVSDSFSRRIAAESRRNSAADREKFNDPLVFLEHCHQLGAGGVQLPIGTRDQTYIAKLRDKLAQYQMYLEGSIHLPKDRADTDRFAGEIRTAKEAGAGVIRTFMLGGRRYETFNSAETFRKWAAQAFQSLALAEPIVARQDVRLAVENHKDWRVDELLGILKRLDSQHVGVCVDTGNSIALLEDPLQVVKAYAPWAFSTHLKDMAVVEYDEGFLLAEVPLGQGFLDLKLIIRILRAANPDLQFNLEMITRDPLKIPCLTPKYWATFESLPGKYLAQTLVMVRQQASPKRLLKISELSQEDQVAQEEKNVRECLNYAKKYLEL